MKNFFRLIAVLVLVTVAGHGQAISVNGGSIEGTISDPTGAAIPGASVIITSPDTGYKSQLSVNSLGHYSVGPLNPGNYVVQVTAPGFNKLVLTTVIRTGTVTNGNAKLVLGQQTETVEVNAGQVQVNTDQISVSGVLTQKDFDELPVNGRNFLDFAQLQPGVQLQNGDYAAGGFDPTKAGFSALSFSGVSGRTTRIMLDGQDITDETVGTTIYSVVPSGVVSEMEVNRATADASVDITSSGSVIASTRTGTNSFHGNMFYNFQDYRALFANVKGQAAPFQRNQFGGYVGGPILKDKLFFYGGAERIKQDSSTPNTITTGTGSYFSAILAKYPTIPTPSRNTFSFGRLDYDGPHGIHLFARGLYGVDAFATGGAQLYANRDNTPGIAGGADFVTGKFTHSFRGSYEKFHNLISDASNNPALYDPIPGFAINYSSQGLHTGPNDNAPQQTFQSDKQFRYDGSWSKGRQSIRYGASFNRILGGGFASFFGLGPYAALSSSTRLFPGQTATYSDPLNGYHAYYVYVGNGQGSFTEVPQFGFPGGGQGDWRLGFYLADSIKLTPTFTLTVAARYDRDTGRSDADLAPIPCSVVDLTVFGTSPCSSPTANLLDQWGTGLGSKVAQPNRNVGPQIGFNYAPAALHNKTSLRGGFGIYYESSVFNNVLFDRPFKLATGHFNAYNLLCYGNVYTLAIPGKGIVSTNSAGQSIKTLCGESIAQAAPGFITLENDYKTASAATVGANPTFVGETLTTAGGSYEAYAPNYRSPYSIDFNFGIQQQVFRGAVLSVDYVHSATLHIEQAIDANHTGDAAYLNSAAAKAAISATTGSFGCAGGSSAAAINCAIQAGASIGDFAGNGLDSGNNYLGDYPASIYGLTASTGAAFPGVNPNVGVGSFQFPTGKSAYDGAQFNFRQQSNHPLPGIVNSNIEASYAYSRFITSVGGGSSDQFFSPGAQDYRNATRFMGYGSLDRTHIFSMGLSAHVKYGPLLSMIGHFNSAGPTSLSLDDSGYGGAGQIFQTDVTGDGTVGDLLPGTNQGAYSRKVKPNTVKQVINTYNTTQAGQLTPAGQALVSGGLFTQAQLSSLGAVTPKLYNSNPNSYSFPNSPYRQVDLSASYPVDHTVFHFLPESVSLTPVINVYNALNLGNFGGPSGTLLMPSDIAAGSVNSDYLGFTTKNSYRVVRGIGTYAQGAPRTTEFQLKLNF